jgi:uncharacterized protein (DUF1697 family)
MPTFVSFLRGINVAGHQPIKMADLRTVYADAGLHNPRTHLQSGNVVFESRGPDTGKLEHVIERAIAARWDADVSVIVRTPAELERVIARMPFAAEVAPNHSLLLVMFLKSAADAAAAKALRSAHAGPELVRVDGAHVYVYYPDGSGRSKLSNVALERKLKRIGTSRNFRTVMALAALAT